MRAGQEANLQNLVKEVRTQQLLEAQAAKGALDRTAEVVTHRHEYYATLPDRIPYESTQVNELTTSQQLLNAGQTSEQLASMIASYLPDTSIGSSGNGAHFTASFGRGNLIAQHQSVAHEKSFQAGQHSHASSMAATLGMDAAPDQGVPGPQAERVAVEQQIEAAKIVSRSHSVSCSITSSKRRTPSASKRSCATSSRTPTFTWMSQIVNRVYFRRIRSPSIWRAKGEGVPVRAWLTTSLRASGYWDDPTRAMAGAPASRAPDGALVLDQEPPRLRDHPSRVVPARSCADGAERDRPARSTCRKFFVPIIRGQSCDGSRPRA